MSSIRADKGMKMVCGGFCIPKERLGKPQGDDAYFISTEAQTIGIADGVGGWRSRGIDAGEYARQFMDNASQAINNPLVGNNPRKILEEAFSKTDVEGSTTACILTLKENGFLEAANVGDSGFCLIREGKALYKSPIQQRGFNNPFQLGKIGDKPDVAQVFNVEADIGDIIVLGTDGLFDNLYPNDIEELAKMVIVGGGHPEHVAWVIAEHAYYNSTDTNAKTPFAEASLLAGRNFVGGKKDDITVVVAHIVHK